jgi:hypothetical protein
MCTGTTQDGEQDGSAIVSPRRSRASFSAADFHLRRYALP